MNSLQSLFVIIFIISLMRVTLCFHEVEEKQIYLVLVAGEQPVAFQRVNTSHNLDKLHLSDRYSL